MKKKQKSSAYLYDRLNGCALKTFDRWKAVKVCAGKLYNDQYWKRATAEHFFNIYQGYGIQEDVFGELMDLNEQEKARGGALKIVIETADGFYLSKVDDWTVSSHYALKDFGSGLQRFLGIKYMTYKAKATNGQN